MGEVKVKLTVWLNKELKDKLDKICKKENYASYAEFIRSCIREKAKEVGL